MATAGNVCAWPRDQLLCTRLTGVATPGRCQLGRLGIVNLMA